jgi:hypothetical protein
MKALQRFTQIEMKEHDHGEAFFLFFFMQATWMSARN